MPVYALPHGVPAFHLLPVMPLRRDGVQQFHAVAYYFVFSNVVVIDTVRVVFLPAPVLLQPEMVW